MLNGLKSWFEKPQIPQNTVKLGAETHVTVQEINFEGVLETETCYKTRHYID